MTDGPQVPPYELARRRARDEAYDRMERMLVDPPDERAAELIGMLRSSGRRSDQRRADLFERIRR